MPSVPQGGGGSPRAVAGSRKVGRGSEVFLAYGETTHAHIGKWNAGNSAFRCREEEAREGEAAGKGG